MHSLKVIREAGIRRVIAQGGLEPVSRGAPLRDEPANRYPVTRDDDSLTMLDGVEDTSEAPRRLGGSHCDHEYILSDLVCVYVYACRWLAAWGMAAALLGPRPGGNVRCGRSRRAMGSLMTPASVHEDRSASDNHTLKLGWPLAASRVCAAKPLGLLPETLGELAGPVTGVIRLPVRLDWSERTEFHLDDPAERNVMYERVIREATRVDDLRSYLNEQVLRQVWGRLFLPSRS
jgi:hypothetical protein